MPADLEPGGPLSLVGMELRASLDRVPEIPDPLVLAPGRLPLSVDPAVWPRPGAGDPGLPVLLSVCVTDDDVARRFGAAEGLAPVPDGAVLLGYDVADASGTSLLADCAYLEHERDHLAPLAVRLSEHHLFTRLEDALAFAALREWQVREHAPLYVWAIHLPP